MSAADPKATVPSTLPLRLAPGDDLRGALEALCREKFPQGAFVVCGIGSLTDPCLRLAAEAAATRYRGPFEILTLAGTVTPQGAHLHMSIASAKGEVFGGHVMRGNVVRTTAEVLVAASEDWALRREADAGTGALELVVERCGDRREGRWDVLRLRCLLSAATSTGRRNTLYLLNWKECVYAKARNSV